jgi:sorting nexin-29
VKTITAELIKHGGQILLRRILKLIYMIWDQEKMPAEWKEDLICPIFKKGDKLQCNNYRGITLLNVTYKILSYIILKRLNVYTEETVGECQCGFRPNRSTIDQIFMMRQTMERYYEYNTDLHMLFIDFRQAFDSIYRNQLFMALESYGIPEKIIRLIKMTLSDNTSKVLVANNSSKHFNISTGVRQGDALSAALFNVALNMVLEGTAKKGNIVYKSKQIFAYADDIVLVTRNTPTLKELFSALETEGRKMGLRINKEKTKYMKLSFTQTRRYLQNLIIIGDFNFEGVDSFTYLGSVIDNGNKMWKDIHSKIITANRAYSAHIKLFRSKRSSRNTKLKIYKTLKRPILSYGSEAWTMTSEEMNAVRIFERKIVRKVYGPINEGESWRIRTNKEIEDILEGADIVKFIKSRWCGHIDRMNNERMTKNNDN